MLIAVSRFSPMQFDGRSTQAGGKEAAAAGWCWRQRTLTHTLQCTSARTQNTKQAKERLRQARKRQRIARSRCRCCVLCCSSV